MEPKSIGRIWLYFGRTDFKLDVNGFRKFIDDPKPRYPYVFASKSMSAVKIVETEKRAHRFYQKKLFKGESSARPREGAKLTKEEISYTMEGVSLVARIESKGRDASHVFAYSGVSSKRVVRCYDFSTSRETAQGIDIIKGYKGAITDDKLPIPASPSAHTKKDNARERFATRKSHRPSEQSMPKALVVPQRCFFGHGQQQGRKTSEEIRD